MATMKKAQSLTSRSRSGPTEELTFETIETDTNILKAHILKDGKSRSLYVLAIPEDDVDDFSDEEFEKEVEAQNEYAY